MSSCPWLCVCVCVCVCVRAHVFVWETDRQTDRMPCLFLPRTDFFLTATVWDMDFLENVLVILSVKVIANLVLTEPNLSTFLCWPTIPSYYSLCKETELGTDNKSTFNIIQQLFILSCRNTKWLRETDM